MEEFFKITPTTVLPPEIRAGHDISIQVELDTGFEIQKVNSVLHEITVKKEPKKAIIELNKL